jgi:hypothetical protein
MGWLLVSVAFAVLVLGAMYRRSEPQLRRRGLLFTVGWLAITAPAVYFRLDQDSRLTAASFGVGLAIFAAVSRLRFDLVARQASGERPEDTDEEPTSVKDWILVAGPLVVLGALIFWPF